MKGKVLQAPALEGMHERVPAPVPAAELVQNMTVDPTTGGWSSRVGYERYRPNPAVKFQPFTTMGRVDSIHVFDQVGGGARYHVLLESAGTLSLYWETGTGGALKTIAQGRNVPTPSEPATLYSQVGQAVLLTNGVDRPLLVNPWPLDSSGSGAAISRPLGWAAVPPAPEALGSTALTSATASSSSTPGDSVSVWWPSTPGAIEAPGRWGIGARVKSGATATVESAYRYAVSFISDTGSESPRSTLSAPVEWNNDGTFRYAVALRIPVGPDGTVARRLYRTKNIGDDGNAPGDPTLYFLLDIANNVEELVWDAVPSSAQGDTAPSLVESTVLPAPFARVSATYADCLFLDGGPNDGTRLYYSHPGLPDQFGAADYVQLPSDGGNITGLYSYYTLLLVLRESGVDVVTGSYPDFRVSTVTQQVACRSPHAVEAVPGLGIVFLAADGVYRLTGGLEGGAVFDVERVSDPIRETLQTVTQDCAPRAVARYSPLFRELHLYVPTNGNDRPDTGLVYHAEKQGWSVRSGFPVGAIDRLYSGALVFGHNLGAEAGPDSEAGVFVLSGRRAMGASISGDVLVENPPPVSTWRSAWLNLGDAQLEKQVQYVTLWVTTTGDPSVALVWRKDWSYQANTGRALKLQPPDAAEVQTYGEAVLPSTWERERVVPLRYAVAVQSCAWFQFEVSTSDDVVLVGWEVEFTARGTRVVEGRRP